MIQWRHGAFNIASRGIEGEQGRAEDEQGLLKLTARAPQDGYLYWFSLTGRWIPPLAGPGPT